MVEILRYICIITMICNIHIEIYNLLHNNQSQFIEMKRTNKFVAERIGIIFTNEEWIVKEFVAII